MTVDMWLPAYVNMGWWSSVRFSWRTVFLKIQFFTPDFLLDYQERVWVRDDIGNVVPFLQTTSSEWAVLLGGWHEILVTAWIRNAFLDKFLASHLKRVGPWFFENSWRKKPRIATKILVRSSWSTWHILRKCQINATSAHWVMKL